MKLALFFTRNISLRRWLESGLLDREKLLYERHLQRGHFETVFWLTYGERDEELAARLKKDGLLHADIIVLNKPRIFAGRVGNLIYSLCMPFIHRRFLKDADILKTNQMDGSWGAVIAKWLYRKRLVVRTGWTMSKLPLFEKESRFRRKVHEWVERFAYRFTDVGVVSSTHDKEYLLKKYALPAEKIKVIHNYIDTTIFRPIPCEKYPRRIVFVGSLTKIKNLHHLVEAVAQTDLTLDLYGSGGLKDELQALAEQRKAMVNFMGVVPNDKLPDVLNRYQYYILPSVSEGMPKSLLEAMACGLVCIGTDIEGINEVIEDGVNGYLAKTPQPDDLVAAMNRAIRLPHESIADAAVKKISSFFSLDVIGTQEQKLLTAGL